MRCVGATERSSAAWSCSFLNGCRTDRPHGRPRAHRGGSDSGPRGVFAFAPVQTLTVATAAPKSDVDAPPAKTVLAREVSDPNVIRREIAKRENIKPCRGLSYEADSPCVLEPTSNPELAAPEPNPPVAAVVRTEQGSDRTIVAELHPAASLENRQTVEVIAPLSTDAVPAPVETPTLEPPATPPRQRSGQRHTYQQSSALFDFHPRRGRRQLLALLVTETRGLRFLKNDGCAG